MQSKPDGVHGDLARLSTCLWKTKGTNNKKVGERETGVRGAMVSMGLLDRPYACTAPIETEIQAFLVARIVNGIKHAVSLPCSAYWTSVICMEILNSVAHAAILTLFCMAF
eukprot:scaffold14015_cov19-Tisochrysis_lutea.AAC.1